MSTLHFMIVIGFGYLTVFLFLIPFKVFYGHMKNVPKVSHTMHLPTLVTIINVAGI